MSDTIYTALMAAKPHFAPAIKTQSNSHFKSRYADLQSVLDAVEGALHDHGVLILTENDGDNLATVLLHVSSNTSVRFSVPLLNAKGDMQGLGSAITYARRYGLLTICGIAPEDDDGNAASQKLDPEIEAAKRLAANTSAALKINNTDWLRDNVFSAPNAVRARLASMLTKEERDSLVIIKRMLETPERMSANEIPNGGIPE